jgi:hypothetical protein
MPINIPYKKIIMSTRLVLFALVVGLIISCGSLDGKPVELVPVQELNFPKAEHYDALIRTNNDLIVLLDGGNLGDLQSYAKEGDQDFTQFTLPDDSQCAPSKYYAYEALSDGRLQVWKWCLTGNGGVNYLMTLREGFTKLEELLNHPLDHQGVNPDLTKAIGYLDGGFKH